MNRMHSLCPGRAFFCALIALPFVRVSAEVTVLTGATLITMEAGKPAIPDGVVVIESGRILAAGPKGAVTVPTGSTVIATGGGYLLPGLADFHVHCGERGLALMVANGVTTARELSGTEQHLRWRAEIEAGRRVGPRLVVFSPLLSDREQPSAYRVVTDVATARKLAAEFAAAGYDGLKLYDGLSAEVYAAFAEEARARSLRMTGHIPTAVGLAGVLRAGQSLEHAEKTVIATCGHDLDPAKLGAAIEAIAQSDIWLTPTLAVQEVLALQRTAAYGERLNRPELAWMGAGTLAWWNSMRGSAPVDPAGFGPRFLGLQRELTREVGRRGIRLLAGTDTPNPGMVPGFALVDELLALERAGLSRREALAAATTAPAEYLGESGRSGVIAAGARADLILVKGDPLANLEALRRPSGVMLAGRWLSRPELDELLESARPKPPR